MNVYVCIYLVCMFLSICSAYESNKVRKCVCIYVCERWREHEIEIKSGEVKNVYSHHLGSYFTSCKLKNSLT